MRKFGLALILMIILMIAPITVLGARVVLPEIPENYAVLDMAGVVSGETVRYVFEGNNELYFDTGAEIFFYIFNFVPMGGDIEAYGMNVFNHWQLGRADTNNGVLVSVAVAEGLVWMTVGDGLTRHMPASVVNGLFEDYFLEYINVGDYDKAVAALFDAVSERIYQLFPPAMYRYEYLQDALPTSTAFVGQDPAAGWVNTFVVMFVLLFIIAVVLMIFKVGFRSASTFGRVPRIGRRRRGGFGGIFMGYMLGSMRHRQPPPTSRHGGGIGGGPRLGGGIGGGSRPSLQVPRRPGAGSFGGYGAGRGGISRGGGGGISRGGMGGGRRR
jgi:uncharacterized protein